MKETLKTIYDKLKDKYNLIFEIHQSTKIIYFYFISL